MSGRLWNIAGFALLLVLLAGPAASQSAETQPVIVKFRSAPDILDDTAAADAAKAFKE